MFKNKVYLIMKNKVTFEQLQDYVINYVNSSENKRTALEDLNHLISVLYIETQIKEQTNEPT